MHSDDNPVVETETGDEKSRNLVLDVIIVDDAESTRAIKEASKHIRTVETSQKVVDVGTIQVLVASKHVEDNYRSIVPDYVEQIGIVEDVLQKALKEN